MSLLLFSAWLSLTAPAPLPASDEIIVIGRQVRRAQEELNACLARRCAPDQDIDSTLVLAEAQILSGAYRGARSTLLKSIGRNKKYASSYPIPVSDLYRANGRVAANLGLDRDYMWSSWEVYRTLNAALPDDTSRKFGAYMELAEVVGKLRGHERARLYYERIAAQARKEGRYDIAALAQLRSALKHLPPWMAKAEIRAIASSKDPRERAAALESKLALARLAYEENDEAEAAAMQAELADLQIKHPILIYSPPFELNERELPNGSEFGITMQSPQASGGLGGAAEGPGKMSTSNLPLAMMSATKRISANYEDLWIDVGFEISPDGRVRDVKVLRKRGAPFWTRELLTSIAGRRYTASPIGSPSSHRKERYTLTAGYESKSGTHMEGRSPGARIEYIDLSPDGLNAAQ